MAALFARNIATWAVCQVIGRRPRAGVFVSGPFAAERGQRFKLQM
jgi:hypothetical protein